MTPHGHAKVDVIFELGERLMDGYALQPRERRKRFLSIIFRVVCAHLDVEDIACTLTRANLWCLRGLRRWKTSARDSDKELRLTSLDVRSNEHSLFGSAIMYV